MSNDKTKDWQKIKDEIDQEEIDMEAPSTADEEEGEKTLDHQSYTDLEEKLTLSEQKAHEHWKNLQQASAELQNVRKRAEKDVMNAHRYGAEKLILSLLPVLDSLEQALQLATSMAESKESMVEGLQLTIKLFMDALERHHVTFLNPVGEMFNPQEHEAMSLQESPDAVPNSIVVVVQKGYKLHDRVIRPARVIVAKGK